MSILVPFNGVNYIIPTPGETGWGSNLDSFFVAIGAGSLQKIGGSFLLANDVNFGPSFGLIAEYFTSRTGNAATTGAFRLANGGNIAWRNAANTLDLPLGVNGSDQLTFNGVPITPDAFTANRAVITDGGGLLTVSPTTATEISYVSGVTSAIQTQINTKKTIATGNAYKFETTDASGNLQEITVTASRAVATDANGLPIASATTATELGYVSGVTSAIQTQINSKATDSLVVHLAGTETITGSKTFSAPITLPANNGSGSQILFGASGNNAIYVTSTPEMALKINGTVAVTIDPNVTTVNGALTIINPASPELEFNFGSFFTAISVTSPAASRTYTLPDSGTNSNFLLSGWGQIVNADVSASAAIAYSKLTLTNSIVNADVNTTAAIVYSKLNLTGGIVNADVNAAAAIAYSKLNLSASIVNADIATAAAIVRSKLASTETTDVTYASGKGIFWTDSGTNTVKLTAPTTITSTYTLKWPIAQGASNQYLTNDGSGNLSWTNAAGTGTVNSGTQFQLAYYATSTSTVSGLTLITASRALASDANGLPVASATTATELGFVSGVTSAIQTQINTKAPTASPTFTGVVSLPAGSASAPSLNFGTANAGIFAAAAGDISISGGGVRNWGFDSSGVLNGQSTNARIRVADGTVAAPSLSFVNQNACGLYVIGTNDIGFATNGIIGLEINSSQAVSIRGTNTNNNATAGFVGETVSSAASAVSFPASGNYGDLTSISLTAGDWLVSINGFLNDTGGGSTITSFIFGISTTTGNSSSGLTNGDTSAAYQAASFSTGGISLSVPFVRASLSGTTIYYLKFESAYTGSTPTANGRITAVRIR